MKKIKYLDLFAGAGGLTEGFMQTGSYDEVAAVEWLKPQVETLRNRLKKTWGYSNAEQTVMHFDIQREDELFSGWNDKTFGKSEGLEHFVNEAGGIDMVIGGPPCQAYSVAGRVRDKNSMQNDYRNYLFEHYLSVVGRYQPKIFIFENVPGMLSAKPGGKKVTDLVKQGFESIGYEIINDLKEAVVNAKYYGVPQSRKRVIILGVRKNSVKDSVDIQTILNKFYNSILPTFKSNTIITVKDAIDDLQKFTPLSLKEEVISKKLSYAAVPNSGKKVSWQVPRYHNNRDIKIFNMLAKDIEAGTGKYTDSKTLSKIYEENVGSKSPIHRYHVLRPDKPSTTIIAHLYKDGNRFIHYDSSQSRTITVREAARLQSFPDDFEFIGSQGASYQMIGNAVPPKLGKSIAQAVKSFYEECIQ